MVSLITLSVTTFCIFYLFLYVGKNRHHDQIRTAFYYTLICILIWCIGLILQLLFSQKFNINPIYFDYIVYIGTCFLPVPYFFIALIFAKTKISFNKKYLLLGVIPMLTLLIIWTNDFHHLFYVTYSTDISNTVFGPYFYVHSCYTYLLYFAAFYYLIKYSIKLTGLFSIQVFLIVTGTLIPLVVNVLGFLNILEISIYITPLSFVLAILFYFFAIFKFGFLNITPIAFQKIADRMSNGYIVLNEYYNVADCNKTLLDTFSLVRSDIIGKNIFNLVQSGKNSFNINLDKLQQHFDNLSSSDETISIEKYFKSIKKYFTVEINSIKSNNNVHIGYLLLFNDITQHKQDLKTIENNQEILIEKERLATLGQMIGGIAHNLKTPIMSISGAVEGIVDLINEYKTSIGDPEVTKEDHLAIAHDMEEWIQKIHTHLSYMSDVITTVKGQAVAFSDNTTFTSFTIEDFVRQVNILMKHELSHALVELEVITNIPNDTVVKGNINSLVQVVNNILSNAIQAYGGKPNQKIILEIYPDNSSIIFKIQDFAGGLPDHVQDKLFKEMVTTKGKNGTGLGLFMSYSNIKAHFNGEITFESIKGQGTTFFISIPN